MCLKVGWLNGLLADIYTIYALHIAFNKRVNQYMCLQKLLYLPHMLSVFHNGSNDPPGSLVSQGHVDLSSNPGKGENSFKKKE